MTRQCAGETEDNSDWEKWDMQQENGKGEKHSGPGLLKNGITL